MQITFLVGNGFDIAAGLDTSYSAFYKWYCQQPSPKKHIERFKREIADDIRAGGKNWADFEVGLGQYTSHFSVDNAARFLECYEDAHEMIVKFLEMQKDAFDLDHISEESLSFLKNGLLRFYQDLSPQEIRLFEDIIDNDKSNNTVINFLSFNYTNTLDRGVEELSKSPLKQWSVTGGTRYMSVNKKVVHMHGQSTAYPILGVDNATQIANQELLSVPNFADVLLKPQSVNAIGELWHSEAQEIISKSKIIGIFGMSLGQSDAKWWNIIIKWLKDNPARHLIVFWHTSNPPNGISIFRKLVETQKAKDALYKYYDLTQDEMKSISPRIHVAINTKNVLNFHLDKKNSEPIGEIKVENIVFAKDEDVPVAVTSDDPQNKEKALALL